MSWKDIIKGDEYARNFGSDDLDERIRSLSRDNIPVIYEGSDGEKLEVTFNIDSPKDELSKNKYRGSIKEFLERLVEEKRPYFTEKDMDIADELDIEMREYYD